MAFRFGKRSLASLAGVHPHILDVVHLAITITPIDFVVLEGRRTLARQRELVAAKASRTMNSRHLTGHAVDLVPIFEGKPSWRESLFPELAKAVKKAREEVGVPLEWGFDLWGWDMPHWQLPRRQYP